MKPGLTCPARALSEYVPPRHDVHANSRVIPMLSEYFPATQLVQLSALPRPSRPQLPAGHNVHCQNARISPDPP